MLAPAPLQDLSRYLDHWAAARLSCEPADRSTAEEGVRLAYHAAGLPPPQRIIWCDSPIAMARSLAAVSRSDDIGVNVKSEVFTSARERVGTFAEIFWKEVITAAAEMHARFGDTLGAYEQAKLASANADAAVVSAANSVLRRMRTRTRHAMRSLQGMPRVLPRTSFVDAAITPHDLASLGVYEYLHDALAWRGPVEPLRGLWNIARSAGWVLPYEQVCWICERPTQLRTDAKGRLHCPDGPAVRYPDGWSVFAWKGVRVSPWMIEHPERITSWQIAGEHDPVLRNCMIEIMTPQRFVRSGGANRVAQDETGVLWRRLWGFRGVTIGSWTAVEVENGTPEADGTRRHYWLRVPSRMRTAREAVAWTYGLSAEQYANLQLRT
jgi:Domain of unknown function (DUF6745)